MVDNNSLYYELKAELIKFNKSLDSFENNISRLQNVDEKELPWTGPYAYSFVKSAVANYDHNVTLYANLEKCCKYLESKIN